MNAMNVDQNNSIVSYHDYMSNNASEARKKRVLDKKKAIKFEYDLSKVRKRKLLTQKDLSNTLGITQSTLSDFEKVGKDIKLSSLKHYIEALGGSLSITITFDENDKEIIDI